ncbi:MAG: hypothetical protein KAV87_56435 [Desulfobacteraceae bacterium]|nr:hypothetical protein [Desulfobacteraceae bacterium]
MKASNDNEFVKKVLAAENLSGQFEPQVYYDEDADCVEFVSAPDDFYAERIDELITVYYSRENNELIGSLIKGVRALLQTRPSLGILVQDGRVKLAHIFIAHIAMERQDLQEHVTVVYRHLIAQAEANKAEFEMSIA